MRAISLAALALMGAVMLAGCGSGNEPIDDKDSIANTLEQAKKNAGTTATPARPSSTKVDLSAGSTPPANDKPKDGK